MVQRCDRTCSEKRNLNDVNNYRGITLVSVSGKLFSHILNNRLIQWSESLDKLNESQFGFRPGKSTSDCVFILHSIVSNILDNGEKLYTAFVDFRKAFDCIPHHQLWTKLFKSSVSSKFVKLLKSVYSKVTSCVRYGRNNSNYFPISSGVRQGEPLLPLLFCSL